MTLQPILTNFVAGTDEFVPFTFPGLNSDGTPSTETEYMGRHVAAVPVTNTGRLFPFGKPPQAGMHTLWAHVDDGTTLRFADQKATTPTLNVAWGLGISQFPSSIGGSTFVSSLDVVVFRYAVRVNADVAFREAWPMMDGTLALGMVRWYLNVDGTSIMNSTTIEFVPARVVPGPGAPSVVAAILVLGLRRRR
jgi:hypothetical protein